jgi:predicted nucleic acid binding AN1-type Zn finger protein
MNAALPYFLQLEEPVKVILCHIIIAVSVYNPSVFISKKRKINICGLFFLS